MYLYSIQAFEVNIAFLFVTILFHCKQFLLISRFFTVQNKGILMSGGAYPYTRLYTGQVYAYPCTREKNMRTVSIFKNGNNHAIRQPPLSGF